jgi:hypothetical protein|tara:strand:- start:1033 stop:1239 length:207 start_codon:yes stop_codon:yes gene_type:complete
MELKEEINNRKLEMITQSQQLEKHKIVTTNQLQQINMALMELDVELKILNKWEDKTRKDEEEGENNAR